MVSGTKFAGETFYERIFSPELDSLGFFESDAPVHSSSDMERKGFLLPPLAMGEGWGGGGNFWSMVNELPHSPPPTLGGGLKTRSPSKPLPNKSWGKGRFVSFVRT